MCANISGGIRSAKRNSDRPGFYIFPVDDLFFAVLRKVIFSFVLPFFQNPMYDGRRNKKSQNNLTGVYVDKKCSQYAGQYNDEGNQPHFLVYSH